MELSSTAFTDKETIPARYTYDGIGVNSPLDIHNIPAATKSLVLFMEDPDAPAGAFIHWVVYDIPPTDTIRENSNPGTQGVNSTGSASWYPPSPPGGIHRYVFTCHALDCLLGLEPGRSRAEVRHLMTGHMIDHAELLGTYGPRR